ncbi:hypothetical protein ACFPTY_03500 [Halomonas beimenensis]|uniref:Uncharacterized protein n=1 Tax=Halomonas beimenensis TaxID=475662 RepID=A0A291P565_9GAMM|nr:hypothetical protein [Halomonas beimenensis]ATJ82026.1 hypothetical protein BEI_1039 [Halomonas beimenensis]
MCDPYSIASTMMTVASAGSQYIGYRQQAAQAESQTAMYKQNRRNALTALTRQYGDIGQRQVQEQEAAYQRKEELTRQERARRARARVKAGESGVSGHSVNMALRDISGAAARDRSTVGRNLDWTLGQLQRRKHSARTKAENRINAVQPGQKPSKLALGIGLASTATRGYTRFLKSSPRS